MRGFLGLSVGATNLVAARPDGTSILRRAQLSGRGSVLTGFVERVGDPVPIVAPDGSAHAADRLLALAVADLVSVAGRPGERFAVAVPAHWPAHVVSRVRALLPDVPVVSDATAALTALRAHPGLPSRGVVVLCDFGGTGTSITLADAARDFAPLGPTLRYDEFSGDLIDRASACAPARRGGPRPGAYVGRRLAGQVPRAVPRRQGAIVIPGRHGAVRPCGRLDGAAHPQRSSMPCCESRSTGCSTPSMSSCGVQGCTPPSSRPSRP